MFYLECLALLPSISKDMFSGTCLFSEKKIIQVAGKKVW